MKVYTENCEECLKVSSNQAYCLTEELIEEDRRTKLMKHLYPKVNVLYLSRFIPVQPKPVISNHSRNIVKVNIEYSRLLTTGQFTIKINIWDRETLDFSGKCLFNRDDRLHRFSLHNSLF